MSTALKAAWGLTAFVVLAGILGWVLSGRPVFAVFIVLGVLTAVGAVVTGRAEARDALSGDKAQQQKENKQ